MNNEVVIGVRVDKNMAASDLAGMRAQAKSQGNAIGDDIGKGIGDGIRKGGKDSGGGKGYFGSLISDFKSASPNITAVGVGVAAKLAPLMGSVLSAGIIAGVGVGVAGLGVALAAQDEKVQAAGKNLGQKLKQGLTEDAASFVPVVLRQIDRIGGAFDRLSPKIKRIFDNSAGFLDPLVTGAIRALDGILGGVDDIVAKGKPVIDQLGDSIGDLGEATGDMLSTISGGAGSAARGLRDVTDNLSLLLRATGLVVRGLTEVYGVMDKLSITSQLLGPLGPLLSAWSDSQDNAADKAQKVKDAADQQADAIRTLNQALGNGVVVADQYGNAIQTTGEALMSYDEQIRQVYDTQRNLFDSTTSAAEAFDNLKDSVKKNGHTLDENTEKGRANRTALSRLASALNANYKAYAEVNGVGRAANGVARQNYDSFVKAAMGLGIGREAAQRYARQLGLIPPKKETSFYANTHDAAARIRALQGQVNSLKGKTVNIRMHTSYSTSGASGATPGFYAHGGTVGAAATGGPRNGLTWVGEHGPELADLPPGTRVHSNPDSMRMASEGSGQGGGMMGPIYLVLNEKIIGEALAPGLRQFARQAFQGSAQGAYGWGG